MDLRPVLKSQYHAGLAMVRQAVERCPEDLWAATWHSNPIWQVAYHALFYTHLYLQPDEESFTPWEGAREEYQFLGPLPWPPHRPPKIGEPYGKQDVLEYLRYCESKIDTWVDRLDLKAESSGFWWYPMSKLEHQFVNIRHLQHHVGQLSDRIRAASGNGIDWVGGVAEPPSGK